MRIGINPEKKRCQKLEHKRHRIIIPFWIPNVKEDYFKFQPEVLRLCLQSLKETIDFSQTNITLINNNSCREASKIAEEFVKLGVIDKYVVRKENRGKLENVISEAKASYEDYITISDADFLFYPNAEREIANIFSSFKNAGVVSWFPCPNLAFYHNSAVLNPGFKRGKVVSDDELDLVEAGLGNKNETGIFSGLGVQKKITWREAQYYIKKGKVKACLGAGHAITTYRKELIDQLPSRKIEYVFKNGYEKEYLDFVPERLGFYRLSTIKCYAYHMGNTLPVLSLDFQKKLSKDYLWPYPGAHKYYLHAFFLFYIKRNLLRILKYFNWI